MKQASHSQSFSECTVLKRDPHHKNILCFGFDQSFAQIDLRAPQTPSSINACLAHSDLLSDLDYNPNKLNTIVTCGYDSAIRFWDLRKPEKCLLEFGDSEDGQANGHWVNKVKYNRSHDQMVITGCTSTFVTLYRASSVS